MKISNTFHCCYIEYWLFESEACLRGSVSAATRGMEGNTFDYFYETL